IEGIALGGLLIQPLLIVAAGPAAGHDAKAVFGEPAADRRADTTHAARHVCQFPAHVHSSCALGASILPGASYAAIRRTATWLVLLHSCPARAASGDIPHCPGAWPPCAGRQRGRPSSWPNRATSCRGVLARRQARRPDRPAGPGRRWSSSCACPTRAG